MIVTLDLSRKEREMKSIALYGAIAAACIGLAPQSQAATIVLDFEGVNATYPSGFAFVNDFYNGGTSSDGTSGTNFGRDTAARAAASLAGSGGVGWVIGTLLRGGSGWL